MPNISMKKNMKSSIDLFCTSPASTAICSSSTTMIRNVLNHDHRPTNLHRMNTYLDNQLKNLNTAGTKTKSPFNINAPCISELPFTPRAYRDIINHQKTRKSSATSTPSHDNRRKSSADVIDITRRKSSADILKDDVRNNQLRSYSSRYLLSRDSSSMMVVEDDEDGGGSSLEKLALVPSGPVTDTKVRDGRDTNHEHRKHEAAVRSRKDDGDSRKFRTVISATEFDKSKPMVLSQEVKSSKKDAVNLTGGERRWNGNKQVGPAMKESPVFKSASCPKSRDQVVFLRVSLHCKGCAKKLRKHLSKIEGVKAFTIDLDSKKVTIIGDVNPLDVLTSVSNVMKNAQLWPSPPSTPSTSSSNSSSASSSTTDLV